MKRFSFHSFVSVAIACIVPLSAGSANAQLLSPTDSRCAATGAINVDIARQRMAWALECRKLYECSANAANWGPRVLTNDSLFGDPLDPNITGWAELDFTGKQKVFPLYYSAMLDIYWNAPQAASFPMASWASYACNNLVVTSAQCDVFKTAFNQQGVRNIGLCWGGCYTPEMKVAFTEGELGIKAAHESGHLDLITLAPDATIDNLEYINNHVKSYTVDVEEQQQVIYNVVMESGGKLRVTSEHPLLTDDGIMRQAKDLTTKQSLLKRNGTPDKIASIKRENYFGKVYNVKPVTYDYQSNIVVAQGYLNGSSRYQNEYLDMINSIILRRALPEELAIAQ